MSQDSFLIITIGPIQGFIASARRSHDLWFGSYLLSEMSAVIANKIKDEVGGNALIFPGSKQIRPEDGISNKIVALVPTKRVEELATKCKKAITEKLEAKMKQLFDDLKKQNVSQDGKTLFDYIEAKHALEQIKDLIEYYWVAVPCNSRDGEGYIRARERAEELLMARKNLRTWGPVTWGSEKPKSSLDGERESVIKEELYEQIGKTKQKISEWQRQKIQIMLGISSQERLCGIGLLKRMGSRDGNNQKVMNFPSTSHIAAIPLKKDIDQEQGKKAFTEFIERLKNITYPNFLTNFKLNPKRQGFLTEKNENYDGSLFYEGRLFSQLDFEAIIGNDNFSKKELAEKKKKVKEDIRDALKSFFKKLGKRPLSYYALLLADGDKMGVLIDHQKSFNQHKKLSQKLNDFSDNVKKIIKKYDGHLIYAGGDDVLALLPLTTAVACARNLSTEFYDQLKQFAFEEDGSQFNPSLSVGIAIAHSLTHFGEVRELAKKAEKRAKIKRNSLAILFDKRSGGQRMISGQWNESNGLKPIDERLEKWQEYFKNVELNHGFIYELEEIARLVQKDYRNSYQDADVANLKEMLLYELKRIMSRKSPGDSSSNVGLNKNIQKILEEFVKRHVSGDFSALRSLADELYIALEFYRAAQFSQL